MQAISSGAGSRGLGVFTAPSISLYLSAKESALPLISYLTALGRTNTAVELHS
ncbi:hypothetical protein SAMN00790413_05760 [Deinococcus hopiensis KR-140]|uniref:Uncharacterized protein n=1 Tax=Deinococcus hopiensis KR-140 TaxID=695939 RepID=A0A1W1UDG3_9DEIO|nr:hypothetical protein SAMN00790413_05760 [Deinococcus hopiensis KR-140]